MGYSTIFYGVDLKQLKIVIENHDASLIKSAREKSPEEFDSTMYDDEPSVGGALEAIINGDPLNPEHAHQYGYALKLMCDTLGEWLPDDDMIGDLEPLELQSPLEEFKSPIELPERGDFPYISFLTAEQVKQEAQRLAAIDLAYPDDEDIEEAREAYANCINEAAQKGLAIVTFYH